jgi:hypothetical protein
MIDISSNNPSDKPETRVAASTCDAVAYAFATEDPIDWAWALLRVRQMDTRQLRALMGSIARRQGPMWRERLQIVARFVP